jgi:hypothetical protein
MALHSSRDLGNVTQKSTFERKSRKLRVWVWNICGMIRTANDRSRLTRKKNLPKSHFTLHNSQRIEPGSNRGLFREMPAPYPYKCVPVPVTTTQMSAAANNIRHPCVTALTTSRLTYSALPEKLTGAQLVKAFALFYGTRKLNKIVTTSNIYTTSCTRRIQLSHSDYISFHVCIFRQRRTQLTEIQNQFVLTTLKPPCGRHACGQVGWMMPHDSSFSVLYEKHYITRTHKKS